MTLPEAQFDPERAVSFLERMRRELLDAREAALHDPSVWGGWSVRFNQRLRDGRAHLRLLVEPPLTASPAFLACYEAAAALRHLWDVMNRALERHDADVARARVAFESRLTEAQRLLGYDPSDDPGTAL